MQCDTFARPIAVVSVATVLIVLITACTRSADNSPHPANLLGRWVRLREDQSWGDTMEFKPDGSLGGSAGYKIPPTLRWEIKRDANGKAQYCATQVDMGFCRDYRLSGDTLEMLGGPRGKTVFRRVK
jgi:hypothetical protein